MEVRLVADTNLFFECKSLEDLPWSELGYDPVVILLTKPVLDEIDKHKKGTGRTRKRAVEIFSRVRDMLESWAQEVEIQPSSPKVVLRRMPSIAPDPAYKEHLDYAKTDDRSSALLPPWPRKYRGVTSSCSRMTLARRPPRTEWACPTS